MDAMKEARRMKKMPKFTSERINESINTKWYQKKHIRALVTEYTKNRNTHRFSREVNNKSSLEFIKKKQEYSLYHVNLY